MDRDYFFFFSILNVAVFSHWLSNSQRVLRKRAEKSMFGSIWIYLQTEVYSTTKYGYSVRQD
jgi:hypothetical protein